MTERILCVDDDVDILKGFQRLLRKEFKIDVAVGGAEALEILEEKGPYAVVVSDLRMPGMDGIQLLSRVRELAPETVRVMLTGKADTEAAIEAVNEGQLFRFLTKPCPVKRLSQALHAAIAQHRLLTAEKTLLERTLRG
ncbi:MAG: response regulator, partial [Candidatus Eisenbacteria bacterium]|nr:response regulator [Candidatus Eisenbacteria bacterium]